MLCFVRDPNLADVAAEPAGGVLPPPTCVPGPRHANCNPEYLARLDIKAPIRIPKSFATEADEPYHIPCIEMSAELQETLDYESKLDRGSRNIDHLLAEGERSARRFLDERAARLLE